MLNIQIQRIKLRLRGIRLAFRKLKFLSATRLCFFWLLKNHFNIEKEIQVIAKAGSRIWLRTNSMDFNIFNRMILDDDENEYNFDVNKYIKDTNNITILDGGANIGLFSYLMLRRFPQARIIAVEPDKDNFRILCKNMAPYKNVVCINGAIWSHNACLRIKGTQCGSVGFVVEEVPKGENKQECIAGFAIEDLMTKYGVSVFNIIKLDIEGSEYYLFDNGNLSWVDGSDLIMMELHDHIVSGASDKVYDVFMQKGYYSFSWRGNTNFYK